MCIRDRSQDNRCNEDRIRARKVFHASVLPPDQNHSVRLPATHSSTWNNCGLSHQVASPHFRVTFWTPVAKDGLPVFGRILEPLGDKVWSAIGEKLGIESQSLNREDLIRDTVLRSSAILADPIYRRFLSLREAHALASRPFEFTAFEEDMLTRSLNSLLDRRPALHRLLERVLSNTVESWVEISQAILRDRQTLSSDGLLHSSTMKIDRVTPGASDYHDGGRSATKVRFSSGQLLYLKPRDGGADIIWNQMLDEVSTSIGIALPKIHVVDFGSHHWIAEVQNTNRQDSLEFFYSQFGVLAFLVY